MDPQSVSLGNSRISESNDLKAQVSKGELQRQ